MVYGTVRQSNFLGGLSLIAPLYGIMVWPFIRGLTEQMTYNGHLLPRVRVLSRGTGASVPFSVFEALLYLRAAYGAVSAVIAALASAR